MTLSSHKSSYKAQNSFAFSTAGIEKNNSDTFTTTEQLGFEAFYYTMLATRPDAYHHAWEKLGIVISDMLI
jgi:hypothetical protein